MTVTRPGGLPELPDPMPRGPRRRIPGWAKVAAVVLVVVLIALGNLAAKERQERAAVAALDRVDVTLLAAGGQVGNHEFQVTVLMLNRGRLPVRVEGEPRVEPRLHDVMSHEAGIVPTGTTERLVVHFRPRCPGSEQAPDESVKLVVPIAPPSGRVRDVSTALDSTMLWDLSRRACRFLPADEAAVVSVSDIGSSRYTVRFFMRLANVSERPFVLANLTSPGLALSVRGGVPVGVAPHEDVDLDVSVALPACSRLPAPGPRGRGGTQRFGTITLELRDDAEQEIGKQYVPDTELLTALTGLRQRICPG